MGFFMLILKSSFLSTATLENEVSTDITTI